MKAPDVWLASRHVESGDLIDSMLAVLWNVMSPEHYCELKDALDMRKNYTLPTKKYPAVGELGIYRWWQWEMNSETMLHLAITKYNGRYIANRIGEVTRPIPNLLLYYPVYFDEFMPDGFLQMTNRTRRIRYMVQSDLLQSD